MKVLSPEELERWMRKEFPVDATSWSQATDEVRDMCREARLIADIEETQAADFRSFDTPAKWNTNGIAATVKFYTLLDVDGRAEFCDRFDYLLEA